MNVEKNEFAFRIPVRNLELIGNLTFVYRVDQRAILPYLLTDLCKVRIVLDVIFPVSRGSYSSIFR